MRKGAKRESSIINPLRSEIWRVNLEPVLGSEMRKDGRPVLVLQLPHTGYKTLRLCAPITDFYPDRDALRYWRVVIGDNSVSGLEKLSCTDASQVRALDLQRFLHKIGEAHPAEMEATVGALCTLVGTAEEDSHKNIDESISSA